MARKFNGTSDKAVSATLAFGGSSKITISFWYFIASYVNSDTKMIHNAKDGVSAFNGFYFAPSRNSAPAGTFDIAITKSTTNNFWEDSCTRPSAGAWHHVMLGHDRTVPLNSVWIDGVPQTLSTITHGSGTMGTFTDTAITFGHYSSTFLAYNLAEWTLWNGIILTTAHAKALASGMPSLLVHPDDRLLYVPFLGADSPEPDYSGNRSSVTLTGTTFTPHPPIAPGFAPKRGFQPMPV